MKIAIFVYIYRVSLLYFLCQKFNFHSIAFILTIYRYMYMLRSVISCFAIKAYGALNLISWKYTFKRLNEEYEIAKKKQQALDNLFTSGRISQSTRDSFNGEIDSAIAAIEKQQKQLIESMQGKTQELENQIKTLEMLLANYEIQHVAGEIDEEIYQREITLFTSGLETTKAELNTIKIVTNQLSPSPSLVQEPAAPEPIAPIVEAKIETPIIEVAPVEAPIQAPIIETVVETPIAPAPIETAPAEVPVEVAKAEAAVIETAPVETPVEVAPIELAPTEPAPVESPPVEATIAAADVTVVEVAPVETAPVVEAPIIEQTTIVETPIFEVAPTIEAPIEATIVIDAPQVESAPIEVPVEEAALMETPIETTPVMEAPIETPGAEVPQAEVITVEVEAPSSEAASVEVPVVESVPLVEAPIEDSHTEAPVAEITTIETQAVETPIVEVTPIEEVAIITPEPEIQIVNEQVVDIAPHELSNTEPIPQEITMEASAPEAPAVEQPAIEAETNVTTPEVVSEAAPEKTEVEVSIDSFEVPQVCTIETTLDKVIEPVILEEAQIPAHPSEAPQGAQTETAQCQSAEETATEDSNKNE